MFKRSHFFVLAMVIFLIVTAAPVFAAEEGPEAPELSWVDLLWQWVGEILTTEPPPPPEGGGSTQGGCSLDPWGGCKP